MTSTKLIWSTLALAATATLASAGSITYSDIDTGSQQTDNQTSINIPQFDASLGTLTSVDFTLQGSANIQFTLTNNGSSNLSYGIIASVQVALQDPTCQPNCSLANDLVVTLPSIYYPTGQYVGTVGSEQILAANSSTGPQTLTPTTAVTDPGAITCATDPTLCGSLTGTGTVLDYVNMNDTTTLTAGGSSKQFDENASGEGVVSVTYNFNNPVNLGATPEPFSVSLLAGGLLALAIFKKNKK